MKIDKKMHVKEKKKSVKGIKEISVEEMVTL